MNLPTHETRGQRYVALLEERFGEKPKEINEGRPVAATLEAVRTAVCTCPDLRLPEHAGLHWSGCPALIVVHLNAA